MSIAIKVENLSKAYRIGEIGTGTLQSDFKRWYAKARGKDDPFLKIGETNDRTIKGKSDVVWSLKDINFEIQQGEAVGIIGRNGAGKSTLLKILSKVTSPTTGKITGSGRIASLLEVGTGFHPDLTGKDNIYLNGAILGMRKKEISSKFDEIVDFAGIERYINTPVKRYSSGMYVRLAFAVAAYLESEILIIDEVLAVGDAEFQKKCLGKMNEVSKGEGRTILFVSHNMDAISRLCNHVILLDKGMIEFNGSVDKGLKKYLNANTLNNAHRLWDENKSYPGSKDVRLLEVKALQKNMSVSETFDIRYPIGIYIRYEVLTDNISFTHGINLYNSEGLHIFSAHDTEIAKQKKIFMKGVYEKIAWIPGNLLAESIINVSVAILTYIPFQLHFHEQDVISFSVIDTIEGNSARGIWGGQFPGLIRPILEWE